MIATLLSLVFAGLLMFSTIPAEYFVFPQGLFQFLFGLSLFLSLKPLSWVLLAFFKKETPSHRATVTACASDTSLSVLFGSIFLVSLLGLVTSSQTFFPVTATFSTAIICVGLIIDFLKLAFLRIHENCSPEGIANWLVEKTTAAAHISDERGVRSALEQLFSLLATHTKKSDTGSVEVFSRKAAGLVEELLRVVSTTSLFSSTKDDTLLDRYSVAEAFIAKRLSWVMREAQAQECPTILEEVMRLYGRISLSFHSYHQSLGFLLFASLSQNITTDQKDLDIDAEYMMICSEYIKSLIDRSLSKKHSEKETIVKILSLLETHGKDCFRKDRSINLAFLMQPFAEIGQLLANDAFAQLPDREDILSELRRILAQFSTLEMVSTRADMSGQGTDTKSSFKEDHRLFTKE